MAYIGNSPANVGNYQIVDDISSSFNGSLTTFALTVLTLAINPAKSGQLLVNINGVPQEPDDTGTDGFLVSGSNIVFSSAPASGDTFWSVWQGQAVDIGTPSDDVVDTVHIKDDAVTAAKLANSINTEIAANTAKTGITTAQASAITANTAKVTNSTSASDLTSGTLPSARLGTITGFTSTGIDDNATSTAITIDSAENVGIGAAPESGTSSDVSELDMGLMSLSMWRGENQPNDSASYGYNCYKTGGFTYKAKKTSSGADNRPVVYEQAYGTHKFRVGAAGSADAAITFTTAMTIDNAGRVTKPYQPAFWVNKPNSVQSSWGDGAVFATPFSASTILKGGCSLGSSVVTVPTAGLYRITVQFDAHTASYNIRAGGIHLKVNGTVHRNQYSGHDGWNSENYIGWSNHHYTWYSHYLVQASANDTFGTQAQIYHNGGTPSIGYSASMQGYLIG